MGRGRTSYQAATRLAAVVLCTAAALAADRTYQTGDLTPLNMPPTFDNGYLIVRAPGAEFDIYGPDGALAYRIPRPDDNWVATNAGVDADGVAVVGIERSYKAGRFALYSAAGSLLKIIDTGDFLPAYVRFGPDHSIWAAGRGILRRYSRDGEQLGSYTLAPESEGTWQEPVIQLPGLRVCADRVGYLVQPEAGRLFWLEADLNGKELGRWPVGVSYHGAPVFAGGRAYMSTDTAVLVLNRASGKWEQTFVSERGRLIGSDKDALVFLDRGSTTARWVVPQ